jgi:hypothetical protein
VTRCDGVAPRENGESRPVVTVLVTRLPRRSKQELGRALVRLAEIHRLTWRADGLRMRRPPCLGPTAHQSPGVLGLSHEHGSTPSESDTVLGKDKHLAALATSRSSTSGSGGGNSRRQAVAGSGRPGRAEFQGSSDETIDDDVTASQRAARARRFSCFFLRAARLRAVFRRRFAGIVAASIGGEGPSDLRRREVHGSVTETLDWTGLAREEAPEPRPIHHARIGASTLLVLSIGLL